MLVISRNAGEEILIGDNIRVVLIDTRGGKSRIGVEAPKDIPVHRKEIFEKIRDREKPEADKH